MQRKNTGTVKLKNDSLVLRRIRLTDYFSAIKWFTDPEIAKFSMSKMPPSKWAIFRIIFGRVRRYRKKDFYSWAITIDGKMRGFIELLNSNKSGVYYVSYKLDMSLKSKGITTQALKMVIEYMKTQQAKGLVANSDVDNIGSWRVMQKAGMEEFGSPDTNYPIRYEDGTIGKKRSFRVRFE